MTGLDILLAFAGLAATLLVVAGMILLTPRGSVDALDGATDAQGAELSQAGVTDAEIAARGYTSTP
jgi:hypothetical protein